jgi:hypothetical protein
VELGQHGPSPSWHCCRGRARYAVLVCHEFRCPRSEYAPNAPANCPVPALSAQGLWVSESTSVAPSPSGRPVVRLSWDVAQRRMLPNTRVPSPTRSATTAPPQAPWRGPSSCRRPGRRCRDRWRSARQPPGGRADGPVGGAPPVGPRWRCPAAGLWPRSVVPDRPHLTARPGGAHGRRLPRKTAGHRLWRERGRSRSADRRRAGQGPGAGRTGRRARATL